MNNQLPFKSILFSIMVSLLFSCGGGDENNPSPNIVDNRILLTAKEAVALAEPVRDAELPDGVLSFIMVLFNKEDDFIGRQDGWSIYFTDHQTNYAIEVSVDSEKQHASAPFTGSGVPNGSIPGEWVDSDQAMEAVLSNGGDSEDLPYGTMTLFGDPQYPAYKSNEYAWVVNYGDMDASTIHNYFVGLDGTFLGKDFD